MICDDLKRIGVEEQEWYKAATTSIEEWRVICTTQFEHSQTTSAAKRAAPQGHPLREDDKKRHKCTQERIKPISEQREQCIVTSAL